MSPSKPCANFGSNCFAIPVKIARWASAEPKRRSSCSSLAPLHQPRQRLLAGGASARSRIPRGGVRRGARASSACSSIT